MRPLRAWSQGPRYTIGSPVKSPGYGTSTSAVDHAERVRLVHSKYRHPAVQYRLCSVHYGASAQLTVRTATPNSCSLPHLTTGLEHLQHRSTPDSTCSEPCLHWCWQGRQAGRLDIVCSCPQPSPDPPRPRASNRCQDPRPVFSPPVPTPVGMSLVQTQIWTARHGSSQLNMAGHGRAGQHKADHDGIIVMGQASPAVFPPCRRTCTHFCTCEARLTGACCT